MVTRLITATDSAKKSFNSLRLETEDGILLTFERFSRIAREDVFQALDLLSKNFDKLADKPDVLRSMFTVRQWSTIAPLIKDINGNTKEWIKTYTEGKSVAEGFETQMQSLDKQLAQLRNNITNANSGWMDTIKILSSELIPVLNSALKYFHDIDNGLVRVTMHTSALTVEFLAVIGAIAAGIKILKTSQAAIAGWAFAMNPIVLAFVGVASALTFAYLKSKDLEKVEESRLARLNSIKKETEELVKQEKLSIDMAQLYLKSIKDFENYDVSEVWDKTVDLMKEAVTSSEQILGIMQKMETIGSLNLRTEVSNTPLQEVNKDAIKTATENVKEYGSEINKILNKHKEMADAGYDESVFLSKKELEQKLKLEEKIGEEKQKIYEMSTTYEQQLKDTTAKRISYENQLLEKEEKIKEVSISNIEEMTKKRTEAFKKEKNEEEESFSVKLERWKKEKKFSIEQIEQTKDRKNILDVIRESSKEEVETKKSKDEYKTEEKIKELLKEEQELITKIAEKEAERTKLLNERILQFENANDELVRYFSIIDTEMSKDFLSLVDTGNLKNLQEYIDATEDFMPTLKNTIEEMSNLGLFESMVEGVSKLDIVTSPMFNKWAGTFNGFKNIAENAQRILDEATVGGLDKLIEQTKQRTDLSKKEIAVQVKSYEAMRKSVSEGKILSGQQKKSLEATITQAEAAQKKTVKLLKNTVEVNDQLEKQKVYTVQIYEGIDRALIARQADLRLMDDGLEKLREQQKINRIILHQKEVERDTLLGGISYEQRRADIQQFILDNNGKINEITGKIEFTNQKNGKTAEELTQEYDAQVSKLIASDKLFKEGLDARNNLKETEKDINDIYQQRIEKARKLRNEEKESDEKLKAERQEITTGYYDKVSDLLKEEVTLEQKKSTIQGQTKNSIKSNLSLLQEELKNKEDLSETREEELTFIINYYEKVLGYIKDVDTETEKQLQRELALRKEIYQTALSSVNALTSGQTSAPSFNMDTLSGWLSGDKEVSSLKGKAELFNFGVTQYSNIATQIASKEATNIQNKISVLEMQKSLLTDEEDIQQADKEILREQINLINTQARAQATQSIMGGVTSGISSGVGVASGMTALGAASMATPVGWAVAGMSLLGGLLGSSSAKKEAKQREEQLKLQAETNRLMAVQNKNMANMQRYQQQGAKFGTDYALGKTPYEADFIKYTHQNMPQKISDRPDLTLKDKYLGILEYAQESKAIKYSEIEEYLQEINKELEYLDSLEYSDAYPGASDVAKKHVDKMKTAYNKMLVDAKNFQKEMNISREKYFKEWYGYEVKLAEDGLSIESSTFNLREDLLNSYIDNASKSYSNLGETIANTFSTGYLNNYVKEVMGLDDTLNDLENSFTNFINAQVAGAEGFEYEEKIGETEGFFSYQRKPIYETKNIVDELVNSISKLESKQQDVNQYTREFTDVWMNKGGNIEDLINGMGFSLTGLGYTTEEIYLLWESGKLSWENMQNAIGDTLDYEKLLKQESMGELEILKDNLLLLNERLDLDKNNYEVKTSIFETEKSINDLLETRKNSYDSMQTTLKSLEESLDDNYFQYTLIGKEEEDLSIAELERLKIKKAEIDLSEIELNTLYKKILAEDELKSIIENKDNMSDLEYETLLNAYGTTEKNIQQIEDWLSITTDIYNTEQKINDIYEDRRNKIESTRDSYIDNLETLDDSYFQYTLMGKEEEEILKAEKQRLIVKRNLLGVSQQEALSLYRRIMSDSKLKSTINSKYNMSKKEYENLLNTYDLTNEQIELVKQWFDYTVDIDKKVEDISTSTKEVVNETKEGLIEAFKSSLKTENYDTMTQELMDYFSDTLNNGIIDGLVNNTFKNKLNLLTSQLETSVRSGFDINTVQQTSSEIQKLTAEAQQYQNQLKIIKDLTDFSSAIEYQSDQSQVTYSTGSTSTNHYNYYVNSTAIIQDSIGFSEDSANALFNMLTPYIEKFMNNRST